MILTDRLLGCLTAGTDLRKRHYLIREQLRKFPPVCNKVERTLSICHLRHKAMDPMHCHS